MSRQLVFFKFCVVICIKLCSFTRSIKGINMFVFNTSSGAQKSNEKRMNFNFNFCI